MRHLIIALLASFTLLILSMPVRAGGWATVRLDEPPGDVVVGVPWQFGFMVLRHDVSPNSDVTPVVRAMHRETGELVTAAGSQQGKVGHFVAELTLPRSGEWKWTITPEPYAETSFETLTVLERTGDALAQAEGVPATPAVARSPEMIEILDSWVYQPATLEVAPGSIVTWVNRSLVAHTVTGETLAFDDSGLIDPGQSFSITLDEPGTYRYHCGPHPGMEGVVIVG